MNLSIIFIEIAVMLLGFTVLVFGMLLINPLTFISDYPPEIQAEYYRTQHKEATKEKLTKLMFAKKLIAVVVFLFVFAWMLHLTGAKTFWQGGGADVGVYAQRVCLGYLLSGLGAVCQYQTSSAIGNGAYG